MEHVTDSDLDELLDDALLDFDKVPAKSSTSSLHGRNKKKNSTKLEGQTSGSSSQINFSDPTGMIKELFDKETLKQISLEWDNVVGELAEEDPTLLENLSKAATAGSNNKPKEDSTPPVESNSLDDKLKSTFEAYKSDVNTEATEEGLANAFADFSFEGLGDEDMFDKEMGMLENLMGDMLSKNMLYPPMKDLCDKYPTWIKSNREKLSEEDLKSYENQLECLKKICAEFETETDDDSQTVKACRSQKIISYIDEMQAFGDPPADLLQPGTTLGSLPNAESCCIS